MACAGLAQPKLKSSVGIVLPVLSGEGGSGYVHPGNSGSVVGEIAASLASPKDELVVFFGSSNDSVASPSALASAARDTFAKTKAAAPAAKLLVIGPVALSPARPPRLREYPAFSATKHKP